MSAGFLWFMKVSVKTGISLGFVGNRKVTQMEGSYATF
jgi:hypothetical protein